MPDAYVPQSRLLAELMARRHQPVQSVGQGIADALGDIGEAYYAKKADKEEKDKRKSESAVAAEGLARILSQPHAFDTSGAQMMAGQSPAPAQSAFPNGQTSAADTLAAALAGNPAQMQRAQQADRPLPPPQAAMLAYGQMSQKNPEVANQTLPMALQLAQMTAPKTFSGTVGQDQVAYLDGKPVAQGPRSAPPRDPNAPLSPDVEAQRIRIAQASRSDNEPLVQVPDPKDPTKGIYVPRSEAIGKQAFQTPRERMPKVQTYWGPDGSFQSLDSNDPDDQKKIKELGLVSSAPTDTERTAKGFLDRMTAAEKEIDAQLQANPSAITNIVDTTKANVPWVGNYMVSDEYRQTMQKVKDWVRAKLRKESGAVIGDQEAIDEFKTYFGIPGDDANTLEGKRTSRLEARRQLATNAGILGRSALQDIDNAAKDPSKMTDEELLAAIQKSKGPK